MKRPSAEANEGKTPAIGDGQARALLDAPSPDTLKGKRDQAILATFLYRSLRCEEPCKLKVKDPQLRGSVLHLRIQGKRKMRLMPAHAAALECRDFLEIVDVDDRYGLGATLATSQFPVNQWREFISDTTVADAMPDRLVHNADRLEPKVDL